MPHSDKTNPDPHEAGPLDFFDPTKSLTPEIQEAVRAAERHIPYTTEELLNGRKAVR